jgi:ribosomal protein S18 acetylase RimI-like enzyme
LPAQAGRHASALDLVQTWELTLLKRAALQAAVEVIGPFRAIFGRPGELLGFDHALPVDPLDGRLDEAIAALRARYRVHHQDLRIEFTQGIWPGLDTTLEAAGLALMGRTPLMACTARGFVSFRSASVAVRFLNTDPRHPSTRRAAGEMGGVTVGRASIGTVDEVGELYGVITEPAFRRQGVAAAVCSALLQRFFDEGGRLAFLDAESRPAQRLYARLGFDVVGIRLAYGEPNRPTS